MVCPKPYSSPHPPNIQFGLFQTPVSHVLLHYGTAWQGTDLMHNHVLADTNLTVAGFPVNPPCSDQSEDSDYDSIWTAHSYRTASFSRKISVSQAGRAGETARSECASAKRFTCCVCLCAVLCLSFP